MPAKRPDTTGPAATGAATSPDFDAGVGAVAALAEPARRALYGFVISQAEPVSRDRAAAGAGVARHVAKFHLDKLVHDGLLDFEYRRPPERTGPGAGRPAKVYRRSTRQFSVTLPVRRYEFAGRLFAQAVSDAAQSRIPVSVPLARTARAAGRSLGETARRRAEPRRGQGALRQAAVQVLEQCGYEPRCDPGGVSLVNCPFHSLAQDYTDLVCGMNLELLGGLLEGLERTGLEARLDPGDNRCCVRFSEPIEDVGGATRRAVSTTDH
jgi:predicted ArsR family transcriptional regulator